MFGNGSAQSRSPPASWPPGADARAGPESQAAPLAAGPAAGRRPRYQLQELAGALRIPVLPVMRHSFLGIKPSPRGISASATEQVFFRWRSSARLLRCPIL